MSQYKVKKIRHAADCTVEVPGSKSITNRALLMAALSDGECRLDGVLFSDDSRHFLSCLSELGYEVDVHEPEKYAVIRGTGGRLPKKSASVYAGSAGTAARFLTAMLAVSDGEYVIDASAQMRKRPMQPLFEALTSMGAEFTFLEQEGCLPVRVKGAACGGARPGTEVSIDISKSTQFLSALMMAAPGTGSGLRIHISSAKTEGSYIRITMQMMQQFGCHVNHEGSLYEIAENQHYRHGIYRIEPDVSAACYFYAAAALTGGSVLVKNVYFSSMQGDMRFLDVLRQMGCKVEEEPEGIRVTGPAGGSYPGVDVDMNDFSDQAMTLAVLAAFATTPTYIRNIGHIRLQESDRIRGIVTELTRLGVKAEEEENAIRIFPSEVVPGVVQTYEDHRMAMAFALAGLRCDGIVIDGCECCAKTFENYFDVLDKLVQA